MIALNRTHSKTALLCFAFLLAGAGCEQKAETPQTTNDVATVDATTDEAHDAHADHEGHDHDHDGHSHDDHEDGHDDHGHDGHHHDHDHADMITYSCQPEQTIEAHYDPEGSSAQSATSAHLLIDGIEYDLTAMTLTTNNTAGAAFETDIGITDDAGMRWQVNADATKAFLSNKTLDGSITVDNEAVLFDCQKTDG